MSRRGVLAAAGVLLHRRRKPAPPVVPVKKPAPVVVTRTLQPQIVERIVEREAPPPEAGVSAKALGKTADRLRRESAEQGDAITRQVAALLEPIEKASQRAEEAHARLQAFETGLQSRLDPIAKRVDEQRADLMRAWSEAEERAKRISEAFAKLGEIERRTAEQHEAVRAALAETAQGTQRALALAGDALRREVPAFDAGPLLERLKAAEDALAAPKPKDGGGGRASSRQQLATMVLTGLIVETSSDYAVKSNDELILVDATAGTRTVTLPDSRVTPKRVITVKKMNTTGGDVAIALANASDTIDEDTDALLTGTCRPAARIVTVAGGYVIVGTGLP